MKKYLIVEYIPWDDSYDITKFSLLRKAREYAKNNGCINPIICKILL